MGVTIHFSGKLRSLEGMAAIRSIASKWAKWWKCKVIDLEDPWKELICVRNGEVCIYESPVTGIALRPHPDAESLLLEFDSELYMQHFCKTQFAPVQTHVEVIGFLREIEPHLEQFTVMDEAGYWENANRDQLERQIAFGLQLIQRVADDPRLIAPFLKEEDGGKVDRLQHPRYSLN